MAITRWTLPAAVALALALAAPAEAVIQATGTLERTSRTGLALTVTNTGDEAFQQIAFSGASGSAFAQPATPGGACQVIETQPNTFVCDGFDLAPDQRRRFTFSSRSPYPTGAGGRLVAAQQSPGTGTGGPFQVTGPPAPPTPRVGRTEVVSVVSGVVRVRRRGSRRFVRLFGQREIPDGSEVDTRRGTVRITVAADRRGNVSTADVSEGRAIVDQNSAARPTTTLRLSEPLACPRGATAARKRKRRLFVKTKGGRFRTRGNYAAGTAQGTAWRTTDTCSATTVKVVEGTVRVRDFSRRRTVRVTAPGSYAARR